jgi:hypothetical protein
MLIAFFGEKPYHVSMIRLFDLCLALAGLAVTAVVGSAAFAAFKTFGFSFFAAAVLALCLFAAFKCLRVIVRG